MPAFSFHRPRFLRSRRSRSRSPKPSPPDPHDDTAISPSTAFSSRPSSRLGIPGKDMNATATSASRLSVPGNPVDHQNTTDLLVGDRASEYSNTSAQRQPSQASRVVIPSGFVPTNATQTPEPHDPGVQQRTSLTSSSNCYTDSVQTQKLLAPPFPPVTPSQQPLDSDPLIQPSDQYSSQPQHQNPTMFRQAQNFTVMGGNFFVGNVTHNSNGLSSNQFMEKLLEKTIPGAEFDSSARDPPPRCHPGTRLKILDRCLYFIHNCGGMRKIRWVVGAAGVGKSALLQSVVESPKLVVSCHASVFFSINGHDDGTKAVVTISYQLAAKSELYCQLIEREITRDPALLLQSSMAKQFFKLIVEPFIHNPQLKCASRILIVVDGLDECKHSRMQLELLRLISDLCIEYPSSPLVWLIASRPEQHITAFFSQSHVAAAYEKEEIVVDSDEAHEDVELYLHAKLKKINEASDSVDSRWPEEQDLWKLANAAGGLFAYAQTVVRYIDDTIVGSPASQLSEVLNVIDNLPTADLPQEDHPMAFLDALYARILSNVSSIVMMNTRKLLLALVFDLRLKSPGSFILLCNWLGMAPDDAYAALNHLRSVLCVPSRIAAFCRNLELFHKSFMDYISDFHRSGFSHDIKHEARQLMAQCAFRVLNEAPDGVDLGEYDNTIFGTLCRGPGTGDKISLTWPVDEILNSTVAMRLPMYGMAVGAVVDGMECGVPTFQSEFCIRILSTRIEEYSHRFPRGSLRDLVFDGSQCQGLMTPGILKQMPLKAIDISSLLPGELKLQFRRPATTATNLSDPRNPSCQHDRNGKWRKGDDQDQWMTSFSYRCFSCMGLFERHLKNWKTRAPDHVIPTLFTSTGWCCVEFRFVDPDDGVSEWTYWFWVKVSLEERKKYGSDARYTASGLSHWQVKPVEGWVLPSPVTEAAWPLLMSNMPEEKSIWLQESLDNDTLKIVCVSGILAINPGSTFQPEMNDDRH
ncbi:hypothetical protein AGABI2DRAFT_144529 [Agaricus bisporus var. bisporus H97]|uniref:hypothetical protein n=1 Tax=Agaricus bisporus var. bisporus (strain H97 / ATCC MYA-4626 / FGSC 10389) TaxID=936046 RepID=UPI00029F5C17|nr:hypothetical protein AGABI2DRAFT_144529 [Agaricus bisporus var. bisporus H97]EKV45000.1 hypothetical protein AGABI2DRAFT_144529 [Agaricus bisporus var. bisporus H97]